MKRNAGVHTERKSASLIIETGSTENPPCADRSDIRTTALPPS